MNNYMTVETYTSTTQTPYQKNYVNMLMLDFYNCRIDHFCRQYKHVDFIHEIMFWWWIVDYESKWTCKWIIWLSTNANVMQKNIVQKWLQIVAKKRQKNAVKNIFTF